MNQHTRSAAPSCPPDSHHLSVDVPVRATVVISPDETTFEFWGDHEPHLVSADCTACALTYPSTSAIPTKIIQSIEAALADASIMQPLDD